MFNNRFIWIGVISEIIIALAIVYLPFMQRFIGTAAFDAKYWLPLIVWIPALPLVDSVYKSIKNRRTSVRERLIRKGESL